MKKSQEIENSDAFELDHQEGMEKSSTYLGPAIVLKGELSGSEDTIIDGQIQGKIELINNDLIIEKQGKIEAEIHVKNIIIKGQVKGKIFASGKITIEKKGQMIGDIKASRVSIKEGAQFKGSVKMPS